MTVHLTNVNMALPEDALIDLFLFQLYSPDPVEDGALAKLPHDLVTRRSELLTRFYHWLQSSYVPQNPSRPYFVLFPELSVSLAHVDTLQLIAEAGQGTAGVLAGMEFLSWQEYSNLVSTMPDMSDDPSWTANGAPTHMVNSALILLRENDGQLRRFVQPKRNPSDDEAVTHFPSQNVLFFQSNDQTQGRRLNFCVQICSDFTDHTQVSHLRHQLESVSNGRPIDFAFLLQRNADQFAPQFRQSVKAYFDPPAHMIDTSRGCLVFSNVASEARGKSPLWGRSMLLFPYNARRWRTPGSDTYWLRDEKAYNQQAVVLREPGACIYWLRYKPHYLVNPVPGSGQPGPFVANHALAQPVSKETFPEEPTFRAIPAAAHWLLAEWLESKAELLHQLGEVPNLVMERCGNFHDEVHHDWDGLLGCNEGLARTVLGLFFLCFDNRVLCKDAPEPMLWDGDIARLARRFLSVYCLLKAGMPNGDLVVSPGQYEHGHVSSETGVALVCGENQSVNSVLVKVLNRIDSSAAAIVRDAYIVVIVSALDNPAHHTLAEMVKRRRESITDSQEEDDDDITSSGKPHEIVAVCDQNIWSAFTSAETTADIEDQVLTALGLNP